MVVEWDWGVHVHVNPRGKWTLHPWKSILYMKKQAQRGMRNPPQVAFFLKIMKHLLPEIL